MWYFFNLLYSHGLNVPLNKELRTSSSDYRSVEQIHTVPEHEINIQRWSSRWLLGIFTKFVHTLPSFSHTTPSTLAEISPSKIFCHFCIKRIQFTNISISFPAFFSSNMNLFNSSFLRFPSKSYFYSTWRWVDIQCKMLSKWLTWQEVKKV